VRLFDFEGVGRAGAVFDPGAEANPVPASWRQRSSSTWCAPPRRARARFRTTGPRGSRASETALPDARGDPGGGRFPFDRRDELDYDEQVARKAPRRGAAADVAAPARGLRPVEPRQPSSSARCASSRQPRYLGGQLIHPARLAVTGRGASPGLSRCSRLLGRSARSGGSSACCAGSRRESARCLTHPAPVRFCDLPAPQVLGVVQWRHTAWTGTGAWNPCPQPVRR
jgi:hypothetical protein